MKKEDLATLRSYVDQLRAALEDFDEMLASLIVPKPSRSPFDAAGPLEVVRHVVAPMDMRRSST